MLEFSRKKPTDNDSVLRKSLTKIPGKYNLGALVSLFEKSINKTDKLKKSDRKG